MRLNESTYYTPEMNWKYYSKSQISGFIDCEARAAAELDGLYVRQPSQALLVGQYVDEALTGDLDAWLKEHPEVLKRDGTLKSEFVQAQAMVDRAKQDPVFMSFLEGDHQKIVTGKLFGQYLFKGKYDVFRPDRIVDLKTVRDMNSVYLPGQGRVDFATAWGWPLQMAIYQELYRVRYHKQLPCYLAVITKEDPSDLAIIEIEQERMDAELEWLKNVMPRIDAVKNRIIMPERCEHCAYCRATKKLTGAIALSDIDEGGISA